MVWNGILLPWGPVFLMTLKSTRISEITLTQRRVYKMLTAGTKVAGSSISASEAWLGEHKWLTSHAPNGPELILRNHIFVNIEVETEILPAKCHVTLETPGGTAADEHWPPHPAFSRNTIMGGDRSAGRHSALFCFVFSEHCSFHF